MIVRCILLSIGLIILQGCTVGWYSLRDSNGDIQTEKNAAWNCPTNFEISVTSSHYTNTFGEKESQPEYISELEAKLSSVTEEALKDLGCLVAISSEPITSKILTINVTEQKYLSALPQEWLTGLSFGLIPSWGTRPEQWKFEFEQGDSSRTFVVDDTRFNHLVAFPVFWASFPLMNIESKYEKALRKFAKTPNE